MKAFCTEFAQYALYNCIQFIVDIYFMQDYNEIRFFRRAMV